MILAHKVGLAESLADAKIYRLTTEHQRNDGRLLFTSKAVAVG